MIFLGGIRLRQVRRSIRLQRTQLTRQTRPRPFRKVEDRTYLQMLRLRENWPPRPGHIIVHRTVPPRIFRVFRTESAHCCTETSSAVEPELRMTRSDSPRRIPKGNSMLKPWGLPSILRNPSWADLSWLFKPQSSSVSNLGAS